MKKQSSSQAGWSLLTAGVSDARVEAHIVRLAVSQMIDALEDSPLKEEFYKLCGDNLEAIPKHLSKMERSLDKTNYALITMGSDFYRQRLTHEDRESVDMASKYNPTPSQSVRKSATGGKLIVGGRGFSIISTPMEGLIEGTSLYETADRASSDALYTLVSTMGNDFFKSLTLKQLKVILDEENIFLQPLLT